MERMKKIYCNTCGLHTNHELKAVHYRFYKDDSELKHLEFLEETELDEPLDLRGFKGVFKYEMWICRGCDSATLQESCTINQLVLNDSLRAFWSYTFHPERTSEDLLWKDFFNTPAKLLLLYFEIIRSYNSHSPTLCAMGLRTLFEGICVDKGITDKVAWGLADKIKELAKQQHLPDKIVEHLKSFKFLGDAAVHRIEAPDTQTLKLGIEVMEDLLNYLYALEYKSEWLHERVTGQNQE